MVNDNKTDAQVKAQIIAEIEKIKAEAISLGFDYPTDADYETATIRDLHGFLNELRVYISEESI